MALTELALDDTIKKRTTKKKLKSQSIALVMEMETLLVPIIMSLITLVITTTIMP